MQVAECLLSITFIDTRDLYDTCTVPQLSQTKYCFLCVLLNQHPLKLLLLLTTDDTTIHAHNCLHALQYSTTYLN